MSKEMKILPELRFPDFTNNDQWKADTVQNIVTTKSPPKKLQSSEYLDEGVFPIIDQSQSFYCGYTNDQQAIINEDLPLVIFGDHTCALKMAREPFAQGADGIKILKSKAFIDPEYLYQYLTYNGVKQENYKRHYSKLKEKIVPYPEFESGEQQKIASCLSSLDELIAAHNDKLDALKDHKKGLLQNLFPQEGETVPKVRFPEFEDDGEWVEDDIGTLFKFKQGVQVPVSNQFPEQGDDMVRFIRIIDITSNNEPPRYIQHPGDSHIISKDDLFMIRYGTPGLISIGFEGVIANNLFRLIWKSEKRNQPKFWFYAFQRLESFIYNLSSSSSMPAISFSTLEGLKIGFPPTIEEQQKIASCLSALDELITSQQEKIDQLQQHKKGMMQGLFPKIES